MQKESVNIYNKIYVNKAFIEKQKQVKINYANISIKLEKDLKTTAYPTRVAFINNKIEAYTEEGKVEFTELKENEILIEESVLNELENYNYEYNYTMNAHLYENKEQYLKQYLKQNKIIGSVIKSNIYNGELIKTGENKEYIIKGVILRKQDNMVLIGNISYQPIEYSTIYMTRENVEKLITSNVKLNTLSTTISTKNEMETILKFYPYDKSNILSISEYSEQILDILSFTVIFRIIGKWGLLFFAIFASMILMDFVGKSIKMRKKEVGTLRALGCRSVDVIKLFLYESLTIMTFSVIISCIIIPKIITKLNAGLKNMLLFKLDAFNFGIIQFVQILGFMVLVVILTNILLVRKTTKMKPIDAILNK